MKILLMIAFLAGATFGSITSTTAPVASAHVKPYDSRPSVHQGRWARLTRWMPFLHSNARDTEKNEEIVTKNKASPKTGGRNLRAIGHHIAEIFRNLPFLGNLIPASTYHETIDSARAGSSLVHGQQQPQQPYSDQSQSHFFSSYSPGQQQYVPQQGQQQYVAWQGQQQYVPQQGQQQYVLQQGQQEHVPQQGQQRHVPQQGQQEHVPQQGKQKVPQQETKKQQEAEERIGGLTEDEIDRLSADLSKGVIEDTTGGLTDDQVEGLSLDQSGEKPTESTDGSSKDPTKEPAKGSKKRLLDKKTLEASHRPSKADHASRKNVPPLYVNPLNVQRQIEHKVQYMYSEPLNNQRYGQTPYGVYPQYNQPLYNQLQYSLHPQYVQPQYNVQPQYSQLQFPLAQQG